MQTEFRKPLPLCSIDFHKGCQESTKGKTVICLTNSAESTGQLAKTKQSHLTSCTKITLKKIKNLNRKAKKLNS